MHNPRNSASRRDATAAHGPIRTALVLGAGSDIATACVAELARRGLRAAHLAARRPEEALAAMGGSAPGIELTTSTWDALEVDSHVELLSDAATALGTIDLVLCAVGQLGHHAGASMPPERVDEMIRSNFAGPAAALAAAGSHLAGQRSGTIVVLSSVAAARPRRSNYVYGSSKAGLDSFAQGLGDALRREGVQAIVVRPGFVRSKMTEGLPPAPFHTDPATVATAVADAIGGRREVVWVPGLLGPMFAVLRNVSRGQWRRIAGDR